MNRFDWHDFPEFGERYGSLTTDDGLSVYLIPKKRTQTYAVLRVGYGSVNTRFPSVPAGTAHFIEHKLFANEDGTDSMENLGMLGADANAYTTPTATYYLFSCRECLGESLSELLRFVSSPWFTDENVKSEREIISQEIAMYDDRPQNRLNELLLSLLYRKHPIRQNICGTLKSINRITPEILNRAYKAYYRPSNCQLIISGDVAEDEVLKVLRERKPGISEPVRSSEPEEEPSLPHMKKGRFILPVSVPLFALGVKLPAPSGDTDENVRNYLTHNLINSMLFLRSGELFQSLFERGILRIPFRTSVESAPGCMYNMISGSSENPDAVLEAILGMFEKIRKTGLSEADFIRVRRACYADLICSLDSTEEIVDGFCSYIPEGTDLFSVGSTVLNLDFVYADALFREYYVPDRFAFAEIRPKKATRKECVSC